MPPACNPVNCSASRSVGRLTFFSSRNAAKDLRFTVQSPGTTARIGFLGLLRVTTIVLKTTAGGKFNHCATSSALSFSAGVSKTSYGTLRESKKRVTLLMRVILTSYYMNSIYFTALVGY